MKKNLKTAVAIGLSATMLAAMPVMAETGSEGKMDDLTHIVVCVTCQNTSPDIGLVQDAINEISIPAINVEVELKDVTIVDALYGSYFTLAISSGEQIDLAQIPFTNLDSYVDSFQIEPLDELLDSYAPTITGFAEEFPILDAGNIRGEHYGVDPLLRYYGSQNSIIIRKDYMDEIGYEMNKDLYSYDDFTEIFAAIKEKHPDCYPFTFATLGRSNFGLFEVFDTLGGTEANGVLMGTDSTELVDMYETPEYLEFIKTMREWYEAGYILPDAATTDLSATDLFVSGKAAAMQATNTQDVTDNAIVLYGQEVYSLPTTTHNIVATTAAGSIHWTVPVTSESPEAAIRFLNLMYEDERIAQLLYSGVEGTHYVVNGDKIDYPEGVTYETCGYQNGWDIFGDTRELKYFIPYDKEAFEKYTEENMSNPTQAVGFAVDLSDYTSQVMSVGSVVAQYVTALETGSVEDYEGTLQTMIQGLKVAGMDSVIADAQEQFDAWRANQ